MTHTFKMPRELPTLILILGMSAIMALKVPAFRDSSNFVALGQNVALLGILACGEAIVILGAGLDLSVGSIRALAGCGAAIAIAAGWGWLSALTIGIGVGALAGMINGGLITDRIPFPGIGRVMASFGWKTGSVPRPPILTTLATLLLFRYGVSLLTHSRSYDALDTTAPMIYRLGLGNTLLLSFLIVTTLFSVVMLRTRFGRWTLAMGGGEPATRLSGVPTTSVKQGGYILSGLCAGVSGILLMAYSNHAQWDMGKGAELEAIAACVVGGVRITGGDGSILGAALGAVLIALMQNMLILLGRPAEQHGLFTGSVILVAAAIEQVRLQRLSRKGQQA